MIKAIVNVNESWGIGKNGDLLCNFEEDMSFFKTMTTGKIVVYGLNTLKSFPHMRPLKRRVNIVIAPNILDLPEEAADGCDWLLDMTDGFTRLLKERDIPCSHLKGATTLLCLTDINKLDDVLEWINKSDEDDVFICGGASIYSQLIDKCDIALVTKNNCTDEADTFFPNLDEKDDWVMFGETPERSSKSKPGIFYKICSYRHNKVEK